MNFTPRKTFGNWSGPRRRIQLFGLCELEDHGEGCPAVADLVNSLRAFEVDARQHLQLSELLNCDVRESSSRHHHMISMRHMMTTACAFMVAGGLSLGWLPSAGADLFEDAVQAYDSGDYATAFRLLLPLADRGVVKAQVNLGIMYASGHGVAKNDAEAVKWFKKAADQGDLFAQHNLGVMHEEGRGIRQDRAKAAEWFGKAADQGLADAQYDLGRAYAEGRGVEQDYVIAYKWFSLAAARGDQRAAHNQRLVSQRMSSNQIEQAQKLVLEWKPTSTPRQTMQ